LFAQTFALVPGIVGDYLRIAYYRLTLEECALESRIQFGSFFAHPQAKIGQGVYIGSYCILGRTEIGDRTQIASAVQIPSGRRQHARADDGRVLGSDRGEFTPVLSGLLDRSGRHRDGRGRSGIDGWSRIGGRQTDPAGIGRSRQSRAGCKGNRVRRLMNGVRGQVW
jgi:hypothetical protein